jgi:hypothetical protein
VSRKPFLALMILLLLALAVSGCGGGPAARQDEPTEMMAWQFAQGLVRPRVPRPGHATFPRYESSFVERKEGRIFWVTSYVNTLDAEGNIISYGFSVEAEYLGKDVFQEVSVELRKN